MAQTKKLVIGNWKLYIDSPKEAKELYRATQNAVRNARRTHVVVCPQTPLLGLFASNVSSSLRLGAQDVFWDVEPKHTGASSVYALRSLGVSHVILGHSEMRATTVSGVPPQAVTAGETSHLVSLKAQTVIKHGLTAVICIGESERDVRGNYLTMLESQIRESLAGITRAKLESVIIAYEPVWAIGKSADEAMTPATLHETTLFIKKILVNIYGRKPGTAVRVLYGGSVESKNAAALMHDGTVDGFLVGHASVDAKEFREIIKAVDQARSL